MPTPGVHSCEFSDDNPEDGWGCAVSDVNERADGTLWVSNGEYASQVSYCPVCGYQAKVPAVRKQQGG